MNLLRRGSKWLTGQMAEHASEPVTYRQGSVSVLIPSAMRIRRDVEVMDDDGMMTWVQVHEFRFEMRWLAAQQIGPRKGDLITETIDGDERRFEVMPVGGKPAWKDASNDGHWISVMTKAVM